jgi:hypothetical protein
MLFLLMSLASLPIADLVAPGAIGFARSWPSAVALVGGGLLLLLLKARAAARGWGRLAVETDAPASARAEL